MSDRALTPARDQAGATAVEFALVFPVLVALVFAIFQFGWAQHQLSTLRYALNGVSRTVMLDPAMTESQISAQVKARLGTPDDPNVTVSKAVITTANGTIVRLTGTYTTHIGIPEVATYPLTFTTTVDAALAAL